MERGDVPIPTTICVHRSFVAGASEMMLFRWDMIIVWIMKPSMKKENLLKLFYIFLFSITYTKVNMNINDDV